MLPKVLLICLLDLIAVKSAFSWNHVSRTKFDSIISKEYLALIAFVAPWTEPSKALEAEWVKATSQATRIPLLSIDCTADLDLCQKYGVISYPAIRVFDGSAKVKRYRGPRKASAIIPFLNRAIRPTVSTLDPKNITDFRSTDDTVIIAHIPQEEKTLRSVFTEVAYRNHDKYTFGIVSDRSVGQAENIQVPSIVVYKPKEGEQEVLPGPSGIDALQKFLEQATAPSIAEFTRRNELKYMKAGKSVVYYFASSESDRTTYQESLKPLAKNLKEYLNFVTVDAVEYGHLIPALGLTDTGSPALAVFNPIYGHIFPYYGGKGITLEIVESFVIDIVQGRIKPLGTEEGRVAHNEL